MQTLAHSDTLRLILRKAVATGFLYYFSLAVIALNVSLGHAQDYLSPQNYLNEQDLDVHNYLKVKKTSSFSFADNFPIKIAVINNKALFGPIINTALVKMAPQEKNSVTNRWFNYNITAGSNLIVIVRWGLPVLIMMLLVIIFVLRSNKKMQAEIKRQVIVEKQLEDAKNTAEDANLLKNDFLANISHEIRTPMNAVIGMTHLLKKTNLDAEQESYVETLNNSSTSLLILINEILDLTKLEAGKLELDCEPFKLSKAIENVVRQINGKMQHRYESSGEPIIEINVEIAENVPVIVVGDRIRLGQILINLVGNAVKFTPQGLVNIKVNIDDDGASQEQISLHFMVEDTGIGITEEQLEKIFTTYGQADSSLTRQYSGSGLGLSICKQLCELMHGNVWAESEYGKGSKFHFKVKLSAPAINNSQKDQPATDTLEAAARKLRGKRILLVDDNRINLMVGEKMLSKSGLLVVTAMSGEESLHKLDQEHYDCVIMDVQMPGMDGYRATQSIKQNEQYGEIPVIGLSANVMEKDITKGYESGMDDYLGKPLNINKMLKTLAKYIDK